MKIEVEIVKEHKDGSADAKVSFDKIGLQTLIQWGLVAMLKEAVEQYATEDQLKEIKKIKKKKTHQIDIDGRC